METQPRQRSNPPAFQVSLYDEGDGVGLLSWSDEIREVFLVDFGIWR